MQNKGALYTESTHPKVASDLAVHNKKVQEVRSWLDTCFDNFPRVLLLTGPTGSGKSTTVELLCKEKGINLLEYDEECLLDDEINGNLELERYLTQSAARLLPGKPKKSIIFVTSLPDAAYNNIFDFRDRLHNAFFDLKLPVIFCLSDVDSSWHLNPNRLFTATFLQKNGIDRIKFNAVAITYLKKAVNRAASILRLTTSGTRIDAICEESNGDLRLALNMLQMNSVGRPSSSTCSAKSNREETFHMLGRILHAKRTNGTNTLMSSSQKRKLIKPKEQPKSDGIRHPLEYDVSDIIQMSSMSGEKILDFLHENELKFCDKLRNLRNISDKFSLCDTLYSDWITKQRLPDEYNAQISARNVMWFNFECKPPQWCSLHGPLLSDLNREIRDSVTELRRLSMIGDSQFTTLTSPYSTMISGILDSNQITSYLSRPMNMSWKSGRDSLHIQIDNYANSIYFKRNAEKISKIRKEAIQNEITEENDYEDEKITIEETDDEADSDDSFENFHP
ncbi:unnamed protein product [Caenorhabditis angaria]|uniref:Cell cycle checkpoint protein RAD17 n=1 Tax=Caenorhabditis angaria TaxID=860376 RepID=A0A9P1MZ63_9PELO|nr:unnamed protein product [Caenorhabditis angaria]